MSTLSGNASKGEKSKPKFQSLDINNLYKISRGENTEKPTQKSASSYIKHGMQSLGKVPSARRAPANLPSLKSEHSESGAAVPLVPPGAPGWGKQEQGNASPTTTPQNGSQPPSQGVAPPPKGPPQLTPHQQAIAIPSTNVIPPHNKPSVVPPPSTGTSSGDKLWSAVMTGNQQDSGHPPVYQSPQFQHEFPSLSAGDGGGASGPRLPMEYAGAGVNQTGLSLRPQTEGSWTQGGQRVSDGTVGSGVLGAPPQLSGPAGRPAETVPPQVRGVLPPFMYKGSFLPGGPPAGQVNQPHPQQMSTGPHNGRRPIDNRPPRLQDRDVAVEELVPRPIIKEEELSKLDEFGTDMGWAASDDIDYNQKLTFSDDEDRPSRKEHMIMHKPAIQQLPPQQLQQQQQQQQLQQQHRQSASPQPRGSDSRSERQPSPKQWNTARQDGYRGRQGEDEEVMAQKHRQHLKEVDLAIQRAKQRKEEEERRFNEETRQRAKKKLQELNERVRDKRDRDRETEVGTISPSAVPPKPINHVEIPLPEFQKDKERDQMTRSTDTVSKDDGSSFRAMTQLDSKTFPRKAPPKQSDQRDHREQQNGPIFSKLFQRDLPPRFLKQRNNNGVPQNQPQTGYQMYESGRWANGPRSSSRLGGRGSESPERLDEGRRDFKRQNSDDSYRSSHHSQSEYVTQKSPDTRSGEDYDSNKDEDKWQKSRLDSGYDRKQDSHDRYHEDRRSQEKLSDKFERPQRPDSRDSHTSHTSHTSHGSQSSNRRSRDSDLKEFMGSWNEDVEAAYEEKKEKDRARDEKRTVPALVPGPITRDRIEADDGHEKRNLTQLKKGEIPPVTTTDLFKNIETTKVEKLVWSDNAPIEEEPSGEKEKTVDAKKQQNQNDYKDKQNKNNRNISQGGSTWASGNPSDYHNRGNYPWGGHKRMQSRWPNKPGGREMYAHGTDSDGSTDTPSVESKESKMRKADIDERNRDKHDKPGTDPRKTEKKDGAGYVPRGEPSRHGRGGGSNFRGSRMGVMGKRIDGYGPPPSKSPFGHHEDNKKPEEIENKAGSQSASSSDKIKQNQEALAAGIIGKTRQEDDKQHRSKPRPEHQQRNKSKGRKDDQESGSEFADPNKRQPVSRTSSQKAAYGGPDRRGGNDRRDRNTAPRMGGDKRAGFEHEKRPDNKSDSQNLLLANSISDLSLKMKDEDAKNQSDVSEVKSDSDGFQEVKNKKTIKDRPKTTEEKKGPPPRMDSKDLKQDKKPVGHQQKPLGLNQGNMQQLQNSSSLTSNSVNQNQTVPRQDNKNQYGRNRQIKLPPRFAKQELQKMLMGDMGDIGKMSQGPYGLRDNAQHNASSSCSAWDKPNQTLSHKPIGTPMQPDHDPNSLLVVSMEGVTLEASLSPALVANSNDKLMGKVSQISDKNILDGSTPPVNTIIFENTNFKSAPGVRSSSRGSVSGGPNDKGRPKLDENMESNIYSKPMDMLQKGAEAGGKPDPIQITMFKEESDMKLDFFGSDLTHLTEDKSTKSLCITKTMSTANSTTCNADSLNMKIASVKKVWETPEQETEDTTGITFGTQLDTVFKANEVHDEHSEGFSPGSNQATSTTNVCKVKPTQQVTNAGGQTVSSTSQQSHSAIVGHPMLLGTQLSPPPMQTAAVGVSLGPQGYAPNQHLTGFATQAAAQNVAPGSAQYNISAIPSPPTVLYNSTQQLQSGLYGAFMPTADQSGVLGSQGHGRPGGFGQYTATGGYHGLGQPPNSPYNPASLYMQTGPHAQQTAQGPPELYTSLNSYRISPAGPFGQNQAMNNPTGAPATVLISSTSNSLMSATVKPSSQPISAIGTKAGGVGQAYPQQSQGTQQLYMTYDPSIQAANFLPGAGVLQRGPNGPQVQNSVVSALQPSSSYYSGSTGGQSGYYQTPGNSNLPSGPQMQQHQGTYGLQGNVFGTHNQSHTNTGLQSGYQYLSNQLQVAQALSAHQYRTTANLQNPYMKTGQPLSGDQSQHNAGNQGHQLKSPSSQDVSVFNSGSQMPSPKSRPNPKHTPQQSSPTSQRKFNYYQGVGNPNMQQRYPPPIQRPVNFQQQNMNSMQNSGNPKMNRNNSKVPNRQYYGGQGSMPSSQNDKSDDIKAPESTSNKSTNEDKDNLKDESSVLKE